MYKNTESKIIRLVDIDLKQVKNIFTEIFSSNHNFDDILWYQNNLKNHSKSLEINGKIIGGYILVEFSIFDFMNCFSELLNNKIIWNIRHFTTKDDINRYKSKKGIFSAMLGIEKEFRNNGYSKYLIDYSLSLGDYVWGLSDPAVSTNYWLFKQNRKKILQYFHKDGITVLTSTKIK
jgi:hypothetical protein